MKNMEDIKTLSDEELVLSLKSACRKEISGTCEVLAHLIELDDRRLYLKLGYSSLFDYCLRALKYSESGAGRMVQAARTVRDYPQILELLGERKLSLATLGKVAGMLTKENVKDVLSKVEGKSIAETEIYMAQFKPRKEIRETIKPVVLVAKRSGNPSQDQDLFSTPNVGSRPINELAEPPSQTAANSENLYQINFAIPERVMKKLEKARAMSRSGHRLSELFEKLLDAYLDKATPKRAAKPRAVKTRHIQKAVKNEVFERDGHYCSYVATDGTRCNAKISLELDHRTPFALGGGRKADELRLMCSRHNRMVAEEVFGKECMARYRG